MSWLDTTTPKRVIVAGASGSGKTTVARRVASIIGAPHHELDALFHGPGWTPRPTFADEVRQFIAEPSWVTEFQYETARDLLAETADLMIWLDLPRFTVMRQVIKRTLARRLLRRKLWNGNVEPPLWTIFTDPEHIVRWAWRTHEVVGGRVAVVRARRPDLAIVRLRSRREVGRWLRALESAAAGRD